MNHSKDVECPYCGEWQEICHDDGYGYGEDETYEQQCSDCDKVFAFTTSIHYHYDAERAECLNGGEHKWERTVVTPNNWPNARHCTACGLSERGEYATTP